jgi:hypothetical protein
METTNDKESDRAIPQTSNPGPMLAEVAGTLILYRFTDMTAARIFGQRGKSNPTSPLTPGLTDENPYVVVIALV